MRFIILKGTLPESVDLLQIYYIRGKVMNKKILSTALCLFLIYGGTASAFASESYEETPSSGEGSISATAGMISSSFQKRPQSLRKQSCRRRTRGGNSGAGEASRKTPSQGGQSSSGSSSGSSQSSQPAQTAPADQSSMASAVTSLVNQYRSALGLSSLTLDSSLCRVAQAKAEDMIANGYFDHISPTYGSPSDMLRALAYLTHRGREYRRRTEQRRRPSWMYG